MKKIAKVFLLTFTIFTYLGYRLIQKNKKMHVDLKKYR
ncbi:MAG: hypothetical protein XD78_0571 [Desulfotomaculum sp. 46_296]|nr:MAG: hypothetical protein XD78_0571 [Desulfotomaculum sp. 46_296]